MSVASFESFGHDFFANVGRTAILSITSDVQMESFAYVW